MRWWWRAPITHPYFSSGFVMLSCVAAIIASMTVDAAAPVDINHVVVLAFQQSHRNHHRHHQQQQRYSSCPQLLLTMTRDRKQDAVTTSSTGTVDCYSHDSSCCCDGSRSRRSWFQSVTASVAIGISAAGTATLVVQPHHPFVAVVASAATAEFAPGGTLITDKAIGILVNNPTASPYRKYDNSNVLFDKDYYYKFGTGIQAIEPPGNTSFPKTMPFTKSQQRYDALKKYRERIIGGLNLLQSLPIRTASSAAASIADPKSKDDVYQLRAMGLLANGLLASDNNGLPNEVFVARYYINEIYLRIDELRTTTNNDQQQQQLIYRCIEKAINSYLTLMNRVITTKVGEPFPYVQLGAVTALK